MVSKWETMRSFGFHAKTILPALEEDAYVLLGPCFLPAQALALLVAVMGHREDDTMDNDEMVRFFQEGLETLRRSWAPFEELEPFNFEGWSILTMKGDQAEQGPTGTLRNQLVNRKIQMESLLFRRSQGQTVTMPEAIRVVYEDLKSDYGDEDREEHRLFMVTGGSSGVFIDPNETTMTVHQQIAEFLALPADEMAMVKITAVPGDWIIAGEIPQGRYDVALVLVDAAVPEAWWMPTTLHWESLRITYNFQHSGQPDIITVNGNTVPTWPTNISSGDYIKLRWDGHSESENSRALDIFKQFDEMPSPPPSPPGQGHTGEGGESGSDGEDDPDDGGIPPPPPVAPPSEADDHNATALDATQPFDVEEQTRGLPFSETLTQQAKHIMEKHLDKEEAIPATLYYGPRRAPPVTEAFYVEFQGQILPCSNEDQRTLDQIASDEWGVPIGSLFFLMLGKPIGGGTGCSRIPVGRRIEARGRLRGGTNATAKLRGLLKQKGVPEELLDERIEEVKNQIGDKGIKDAYSSFDPWAKLKASCSTRLVKEAESRNKPKAKTLQPEEDPLQANDPWFAAIKERAQWTLEANFFKKEDGAHPSALAKVTHGATGVALVTEREAELLLQNQDHMSQDELAALVLGDHVIPSGKFPVRQVEVPCRNEDDKRVLIKAQMINLGVKQMTLVGDEAKIKVEELDGIILTAEVIHKEVAQWEEVVEGPLKYLKKKVPTLDEAVFATWGKKFFSEGKPTQDLKNADSCFVFFRIKREFRDVILKTMSPGIYFAPRSADNAVDSVFKVVWFAGRPVSELAVLANTESQAFGLVRNRSGYGIRVKTEDFVRLKQRWQPAWKPMENTPYHLAITKHYDVQNLPLSCSKVEVQRFLHQINWTSVAIRQTQPRTWLVGADQAPPNFVHLADHGTVLISERSPKGAIKGKGKGGGKGTGKMMPWLVAGSPTTFTTTKSPPPMSNASSMQVDHDGGQAAEMEDRLQKKIEQFHAEQKSAHAILKEDLKAFKESVQAQNAKQDAINDKLQTGLNDITLTIANQLGQHMTTITQALQANRQDINKDFVTAQTSLKEELMGEVKDQMSQLRKRTPSPKRSEGSGEDPKKQKA